MGQEAQKQGAGDAGDGTAGEGRGLWAQRLRPRKGKAAMGRRKSYQYLPCLPHKIIAWLRVLRERHSGQNSGLRSS